MGSVLPELGSVLYWLLMKILEISLLVQSVLGQNAEVLLPSDGSLGWLKGYQGALQSLRQPKATKTLFFLSWVLAIVFCIVCACGWYRWVWCTGESQCRVLGFVLSRSPLPSWKQSFSLKPFRPVLLARELLGSTHLCLPVQWLSSQDRQSNNDCGWRWGGVGRMIYRRNAVFFSRWILERKRTVIEISRKCQWILCLTRVHRCQSLSFNRCFVSMCDWHQGEQNEFSLEILTSLCT